MTVTVYASTDTSAPTLTNANGSMNALLYACLVTGYGSKSGAGWTRPFTGTGLAAFLQGAGGHGCYLRVFDGATDAYGRRVQLRGYEAMTAISTGTGPFPTTGQVGSNGPGMHYFYSGASSPRPWVVLATSAFVHVLVLAVDTPGWEVFSFGSFESFKSGDTKPVVLMAAQDATAPGGWAGLVSDAGATPSSQGVYVARSDTGASGAHLGHVEKYKSESLFGGGVAAFPYPDRITSSLLMSPAVLWCDSQRRGKIPGLWQALHSPRDIGGSGTTWSGGVSGPLAGKDFTMLGPLSIYQYGVAYPVFETSDTWS